MCHSEWRNSVWRWAKKCWSYFGSDNDKSRATVCYCQVVKTNSEQKNNRRDHSQYCTFFSRPSDVTLFWILFWRHQWWCILVVNECQRGTCARTDFRKWFDVDYGSGVCAKDRSAASRGSAAFQRQRTVCAHEQWRHDDVRIARGNVKRDDVIARRFGRFRWAERKCSSVSVQLVAGCERAGKKATQFSQQTDSDSEHDVTSVTWRRRLTCTRLFKKHFTGDWKTAQIVHFTSITDVIRVICT